ncbi:MAG: hypothetical protein IJZ92_03950 [Bacteroidaceae bacterium]|nr:hypothetical protein [Bacteroidaceae bacterium]
MLIVCKFKVKERNRKGFATNFMHTLAFCVLFQKILHHHRKTLVNSLSYFTYILSEREVGCRFGRTAENAYLRSDGECRGVLHFFVLARGLYAQCFPVFSQALQNFPNALQISAEALCKGAHRLQALQRAWAMFLRNFKKHTLCKHF